MNPLTALDVYIRPKTIAACIGYSASYKIWKNHLFPIELQNGIQQFAIRLSQSPAIAF